MIRLLASKTACRTAAIDPGFSRITSSYGLRYTMLLSSGMIPTPIFHKRPSSQRKPDLFWLQVNPGPVGIATNPIQRIARVDRLATHLGRTDGVPPVDSGHIWTGRACRSRDGIVCG